MRRCRTLLSSSGRALFVFLFNVWFFATGLAQTPSWTRIDPDASSSPAEGRRPGNLQYHTAVFAQNDRMIVFGGLTVDNAGAVSVSGETWILEDATSNHPKWQILGTQAGPVPSSRWMHSAAYDPVADKMIIFGGKDANGACLNDVWVLNDAQYFASATWTKLTTNGPPSKRATFLSAYAIDHDAQDHILANKLIVAGGSDCSSFSLRDAYTLSNPNNVENRTPVWRNLAPTGTAPLGALGELYGASIYDLKNDRLMFWGSTYDPSKFNILQKATGPGASWKTLTLAPLDKDGLPIDPPNTAATGQTAIYNATTNRALFFGGGTIAGDDAGKPSNEVWGLTNANALTGTPTWVQVTSAGTTPQARFGHTAVYTGPSSDTMIVFGGTSADGTVEDFQTDHAYVWLLTDATKFTPNYAAPILTSSSPATLTLGATKTVTFTGTDFVPETINASGPATIHTHVNVPGAAVHVHVVTSHVVDAFTLTATFSVDADASLGDPIFTVTTDCGLDQCESNGLGLPISVTEGPTVASIDTNYATAGNDPVIVTTVLHGTNFVDGKTTILMVGTGVTAEVIQVDSPAQLQVKFTVAAHATPGGRSILVKTPYGTSGTSLLFTVITGASTLTSLNPAVGNSSNPVTVTFSGSNFVQGSMQFSKTGDGAGHLSIGAYNVTSPQRMTATFTISSSATTSEFVDVAVKGPVGDYSSTRRFRIVSADPTLRSVYPNSGNAAIAPITVTLTGTNFGPGSVVHSGSDDDLEILSDGLTVTPTTITAKFKPKTNPSSPTAVNVWVTTAAGETAHLPFTIVGSSPGLTGMSPSTGNAARSPITVAFAGSNFVDGSTAVVSANTSRVSVVANSLRYFSPTMVTASLAITGNDPVDVPIHIHTSYGDTAAKTFRVISSVPTLTSLDPAITAPPTTDSKDVLVTLSGTNFTQGMTVSVAGLTASHVEAITSTVAKAVFTIASSADVGSHAVTVTNNIATGTPSNALQFTVMAGAPTISSIDPGSHMRDNTSFSVDIHGTGFLVGHTLLQISGSGIQITGITVKSSSLLSATFKIAANATLGDRNVKVATPLGFSAPKTFTVNPVVPTISSISPTSHSADGVAFTLTVNGNEFIAGATVNISGTGVHVGTATVVSLTKITVLVTIDSGTSAGARDVTVTTSGGTSNAKTLTIS